MRLSLLAGFVLCGSVGCQWELRKKGCADVCPVEPAPAETMVRAPATKVQVEGPEEVVVQAPRRRVVVETPPQQCAPPAAPPMQAPMQQPMMQQPMMAPQMGMGAFATPMAAPVNARVRERTGLGFAFDTIRIPIPFLRPIPVQRPAEVTFDMPVQQQTFNSFGVQQMGMPMMAPMAAPMAMPMAPMPMASMPMASMPMAGGVAMMPQATVGYGQVTVQSQVPASQVAGFQAQGQLSAAQVAQLQTLLATQQGQGQVPGQPGQVFTPQPMSPAAPAAPAVGPQGAKTHEQLQAELKLLEDACKKLDEMRKAAAGQPPKQ